MSETVSSSVEKAPAARGKVTVNGKVYYWGTGRRKSSVARVRITAGEGNFLVNKRTVDEFFTST